MNGKLSSEVITDLIEAASRPVMVNGQVYKEKRMYVELNDEAIKALIYARQEMLCSKSSIGNHICNVQTRYGFCCDRCLETELMKLNNEGIKTIGSCCGHGVLNGFIQVSPDSLEAMKEKGYEQLPIDKNGNGEWCFKPKSIL